MKILKICGVVAGIHALVILVIFVNPGCSSATKADPNAASTGPTPPAPVDTGAPGAPAVEASSTGAVTPVASTNAFYAPTRPNSAAATVLQPPAPVTDVTPAATYTVKSGDSMWLVAHHNHLKVAELAAANNLKSTAKLHAGQKLIIPGKAAPAAAADTAGVIAAPGPEGAGGTAGKPATVAAATAAPETKYTVKSGESLSMIAKHFGLTTGDLAARNNIADPRKIRPGQELIIPAGHVAKTGAKKAKGKASTTTPKDTAAAPSAPAATETAPGPVATAPDAAAPGPEAAPTVNVPIIKIDGASPSASEPVPVK